MSGWLGHAYRFLHGLGFIALGLFHVWVWARRGYRIPRYIHVMALVALFIGWGVVELMHRTAPPERQMSLLTALLFVLIFPAIVYAGFVFFGGGLVDHGDDDRDKRELGTP